MLHHSTGTPFSPDAPLVDTGRRDTKLTASLTTLPLKFFAR